MKSKTKKVKIAVSFLAVMLIACMLTISMTGCKSAEVGVTPIDVFFVGNMQKDVADASDLTIEGEELVSVKEMLETEGWTLENNPYEVIAGIYALAATNYGKINRAAYMVMTDASVNAFKCSRLGNKDVNVGIRSTYSSFVGDNGSFSQTVSGVTILSGLGGMVEKMKSNFGWNTQSYSNSDYIIAKQGFTSGAEFYGQGNNAGNVTKYIMGAGNPKLDKQKTVNAYAYSKNSGSNDDDDFESDRVNAWDPLDAIETDSFVVANTEYVNGTYGGTSWATSDFSRLEYFDNSNTSISYDSNLDLYTLNITILNEFVDEASDFTKGGLVKDTKDYIELSNAKYTQAVAKIEVYGSGLIKSMQRIDTLESNEKCKLSVAGGVFGSCDGGGKAENRITMAFGYDKDDCDAYKYAALYWPELATETPYKKAKAVKNQKKLDKNTTPLDLSGYTTFNKYNPKANDLAGKFTSLYSFDWSEYQLKED